jgi:hypothetical protein
MAVTVVLLGLGNDGMLKLEEWPDCLYADRTAAVEGEADFDDMASKGCEVHPGSWKVVQLLSVGDVEVEDALSVEIRRCGAKAVMLDGRERWFEVVTNGRPPIVLVTPSKSNGSSSMPCIMLGLVGLLGGGPRICGVRVEIRTQFCLRWPLRAFGLPLRAEGFCKGTLSHWNGLPLLLREEVWVAFDACRVGVPALPLISRSTLLFCLSAGEPFSETVVEHRDTLRGVETFLIPESFLRDPMDDTLRMPTRSAVPSRGIDRRLCFSLSRDEATLVVDSWRLSWLSALY